VSFQKIVEHVKLTFWTWYTWKEGSRTSYRFFDWLCNHLYCLSIFS